MNKIRYGIIGTGPRGQALIDAAMKSGEVEVVALADFQESMLLEAAQLVPEARRFRDYHDLLNMTEVDAVVVATPNHTHKAIVLDCIDAGKHIFSEKPVATNLADLEQVVDRLKNSNLIYQVGIELRYSQMGMKLKELVENGIVGHVRMMWCKEFRPPFKRGDGGWRVSSQSGGTFLEKNVHHFDLFNWLIGSRPVKVSAFGGNNVIYQNEGVLDNGVVIIEYENGARASLVLSLFHDVGFYMELGVLGESGRIDTYSPQEKMDIFTTRIKASYEFNLTTIKGGFDHAGEVEQHLAFVHSIRTGEPPLASLEAVRDSHAVAFAAEEAIRTGMIINL